MFFQEKEYLAVPLSKMKVYEGENRHKIIGQLDKQDCFLSDGTEILLFFEFKPRSLRDYGPVKEMITGIVYTRCFGFKNDDNCLFSENVGAVYDNNDLNSGFSLKHPKKADIKQYLKNLRAKNLYKEYVNKITNFYNMVYKIRSESHARKK